MRQELFLSGRIAIAVADSADIANLTSPLKVRFPVTGSVDPIEAAIAGVPKAN